MSAEGIYIRDDDRCEFCGIAVATMRTRDGKSACLDCHEEWLMGRFDQEAPEGYYDEE